MDFAAGRMFHTFSIIGRCARTERLGIAITTGDIAVGSRCPYVTPGVGAISTQAATDPRLGPFALRLLKLGYSASRVMQELESSDPHIELRQLGLVDRNGNSAARTGKRNAEWAGHIARENFVAMGNRLAGEQVVKAMAAAFAQSNAEYLGERLLRVVEAGQEAGGEAPHGAKYHSAALLVCGSQGFPDVDLRVDDHPTPIVELRRVFDAYAPDIDFFTLRPNDPNVAIARRGT